MVKTLDTTLNADERIANRELRVLWQNFERAYKSDDSIPSFMRKPMEQGIIPVSQYMESPIKSIPAQIYRADNSVLMDAYLDIPTFLRIKALKEINLN